ncbi:hypothetical protein FACS189452_07160 [Bacteroidia bacterium]|nr:hypothetical protein FACS189452_07160 [Bacteroidia bacterium]
MRRKGCGIFETVVSYSFNVQIYQLPCGLPIMFRECLKNDIIPFIIDNKHKQFYYRGLKEFDQVREYLIDTCLSAQDVYTEWIKYFYPE